MVKDVTTTEGTLTASNNVETLAGYLTGKIQPVEFEDYVSIGFAAREMRDLTQWIIGKLALDVTEKWNRETLREFCKRIGYGGLESTVEVYRWTAEQYLDKYGKLPFNLDGELLSYSYYRTVAKTDDPMEWIQKAQDENLTVRQLSNLVKGMKEPRKCKHEHTKTIVLCNDCGARVS